MAAALIVVVGLLACSSVEAQPFPAYVLKETIALPTGAGPIDVLADGRVVALAGADVYVQTAVGANTFEFHGTLPDADLPSFGAAFVRVSPDGSQLAVGNNGGTTFGQLVEQTVASNRLNPWDPITRSTGAIHNELHRNDASLSANHSLRFVTRRIIAAMGPNVLDDRGAQAGADGFAVGVFEFSDLSGTWLAAPHFEAAWIDNRHLALTAGDFPNPSRVTALDTLSSNPSDPVNPTIVDGIGGASGGIAFDTAGDLYTGNGFTTSGPSSTGTVKAFSPAAWQAAMSGGPVPNFETDGVLVVEVLSASSLTFDRYGNLLVGGGDFFGGGDTDFAAVVGSFAVARALAGGDPADASNPNEVRRLDPDTASDSNFYTVNFNAVTGELYLRDGPIFVLAPVGAIPAVSTWGLAIIGLLLFTAGTWAMRRSSRRGLTGE